MNKKLIAFTCILSGITINTFASSSNVDLYGKLAVGIENDQFQNSTVPGTGSVQDYGSYFGIRGIDPVYGDTSAIWQIEQSLDIASGQAYYNNTAGGSTVARNGTISNGRITGEVNVLASRETYLGLQGVWGRVRIGNLANYMFSTQGQVDMYNYGNGANGFGSYSRTSKLMPVAFRYDSPTWGGFNFAATYSFNTNGQIGVSGIGSGTTFGGGLDGVYSGGVYSLGAKWGMDAYSISLGTMIWQNVGTYTDGGNGMVVPAPYRGYDVAYNNAWATRLELSYDDPDGLLIGLGYQATSGLGWNSWANSGGSFNNFRVNNANLNYPGLASKIYQTLEMGFTVGYHFAEWTPKIGYMHGFNMMSGAASVANAMIANSNAIPDSGYDQLAVEVDWNITPRTLVFANFGQIWWGQTMQGIQYCGLGCGGQNPVQSIAPGAQNSLNQSTIALGLSHTF